MAVAKVVVVKVEAGTGGGVCVCRSRHLTEPSGWGGQGAITLVHFQLNLSSFLTKTTQHNLTQKVE